MPRLSSTGFFARPARLSSEKFCMLRAPIWITSAYFSTRSRDSLSTASVTIPNPNSSRTLARIFRPASPSPWKLYGEVRGLYAPPRNRRTPVVFNRSATVKHCTSLSTAQGPATNAKCGPPTRTSPEGVAIRMIESSSFASRLTNLYGLLTGIHSATPGSDSRTPRSIAPSFPVIPMAVRAAPGIG